MVLSVRTAVPASYCLRPQLHGLELSDRTKQMDWLRAGLPQRVDEVIAAVQSAVPEYRVLDEGVRTGVRQALEGFIELAEGGPPARLPGREVYVQFGRGEARSGRP